MKFSSALFGLAALAVASVSAMDTHESGLVKLGERSHELKARHHQLSAAASNDNETLEKRDWVSKWGKVTWYAGNQLDNPACGGARPNDNDMVVAVAKGAGYGKCGEKVHLHYSE